MPVCTQDRGGKSTVILFGVISLDEEEFATGPHLMTSELYQPSEDDKSVIGTVNFVLYKKCPADLVFDVLQTLILHFVLS